jgi:chromosome segregation ATPase
VLCRLEKAYVVVKEKTDASEQLREKASERERERDAASHEVDVMKNQMQLLQKKLAETEARAVAAETELAKHKAVDDES